MERFTTEQVQDQKQRFESLVLSCNMAKAGKKIVKIMLNGEWYEVHNFINRYLELNNICPCMYYSVEPNVFYSDRFKYLALMAHIETIK